MNQPAIEKIWDYNLSILLFSATIGISTPQITNRYITPIPTFYDSFWLGITVAGVFILLGSLNAWAVRAEHRSREELQRKREQLNNMDFEDSDQE